MPRTKTAPSVVGAQESSSRRRAFKDLGLPVAAAGPGKRGRPRRQGDATAQYSMGVRLTPDEVQAVRAAAQQMALPIADYARLQLLGKPRECPTRVVYLPAVVDVEAVAVLRGLGHLTNQLARAWNRALQQVGMSSLSQEDVADLRLATRHLIRLLEESGESSVREQIKLARINVIDSTQPSNGGPND